MDISAILLAEYEFSFLAFSLKLGYCESCKDKFYELVNHTKSSGTFFGPVISDVQSHPFFPVSQTFLALFRLMITRKKDRFDYKVYHKSGRNVLLGGSLEMDSSQVVLEELKIIGHKSQVVII